MYCRNCRYQVTEHMQVCGYCGKNPRRGNRFCFSCGTNTAPGDTICNRCGVELPAGGSGRFKKPGYTPALICGMAAGLLMVFLFILFLVFG